MISTRNATDETTKTAQTHHLIRANATRQSPFITTVHSAGGGL